MGYFLRMVVLICLLTSAVVVNAAEIKIQSRLGSGAWKVRNNLQVRFDDVVSLKVAPGGLVWGSEAKWK